MIVAIITKYFPPRKGGIEYHCYNLAKMLMKKGIRVIVHVYESSETKDACSSNGLSFFNGVPVIRHNNLFDIPNIERYDIVHLHNFDVLPHLIILFIILLKRKFFVKKGKKIIITLHGGYTPYWNSYPLARRLVKMLYHKTLGRMFLNLAVDRIIAVSEYEKELLIQNGIKKHKIIVIPNGVEELAFILPKLKSSQLEEYKPYLLFLGRISKEKNIEFIIKGLRYISNINLIVAGPPEDREYYEKLRNLILKLGLENRVLFLNAVDGHKKYELIDNSLALVLTSSLESDGIVIKEAIARGKPVIVSKIRPLRDIVRSCGGGFIIENYRELASVIRKLLNDIGLVEYIYNNNRLKSTKWKWSFIINKIIRVYTG